MSWLKSLHTSKGKGKARAPDLPDSAPPAWAPAPEEVFATGLYSDAPGEECDAAERFCAAHPPAPARLLPSAAVERVRALGCGAWGLAPPPRARARS